MSQFSRKFANTTICLLYRQSTAQFAQFAQNTVLKGTKIDIKKNNNEQVAKYLEDKSLKFKLIFGQQQSVFTKSIEHTTAAAVVNC